MRASPALVLVATACLLCSAAAASEHAVWMDVGSPAPAEHTEHALSYDSDRHVTVLYSLDDRQTWEWNGTSWRLISTALGPSGSARLAMAYDAGRHRTVAIVDESTWEFDGSVWTERCSGTCGARPDTALAYFARDQVLVMQGGAGVISSTSVWNDAMSRWDELPGTDPGATNGARMAYDATREKLVLYGGDGSGKVWEWDGAWTEHAAQPSRPGFGQLVAAPSGVASIGDAMLWIWNGVTWSSPITDEATFVAGCAAAFDSFRGRIVIHGGFINGDLLREWDGANAFVRSGPEIAAGGDVALTYDSIRGVTVAAGIDGVGDRVLEWDGAHWRPRPLLPFKILFTPITYIRRADTLFVYAAPTEAQPPALWAMYEDVSGFDWYLICQGCANEPASRFEHIAAATPEGDLLIVGGNIGTRDVPVETDQMAIWSGTLSQWTAFTGPRPPARRRGFAVTRSPTNRNDVVVLGGIAQGMPLSDVWRWNGSDWTALPSLPTPGTLMGAYYVEGRDSLEIIDTNFSRWRLDDVDGWVSLDGGTQRPSSRHNAAVSYDPVRGRVVLYGGRAMGTELPLGDTWEMHERGNSCANSISCDTGYCVEGVCCETTSCDVCTSCALGEGACAPRDVEVDPGRCEGDHLCDGTGLCKLADGQSCASAEECAHGLCVTNVCAPNEGQPGAPCGTTNDCSAGLQCVDGTCCTETCAGACRRCDLVSPTTGERDGVCRAVESGDPDGDCVGQDTACSGACGQGGVCTFPGQERGCAVCAACNGEGRCATLPPTMEDARCAEVMCPAPATCQQHVRSSGRCIAVAVCESSSDPGACETEPVSDGTPCENGVCENGACTKLELAPGCGVGPSRPSCAWLIGALIVLLSGVRRRSIALATLLVTMGACGAARDSSDEVVALRSAVLNRMAGATIEWTLFDTGGPPRRARSGFVYEPVRHVSVLFGGSTSGSPPYPPSTNETWEWDGARWKQFTIDPDTGPHADANVSMAPDGHGGVILFERRGWTWRWDGATWTKICEAPACGPAPRRAAAMAYDPDLDRILLYGGEPNPQTQPPNPPLPSYDELWSYQNGTWTLLGSGEPPGPRHEHRMTYDEHRHRLVLVPCCDSTEIWERDEQGWSFVTTGVLFTSVDITYDPIAEVSHVFGNTASYGWDGSQLTYWQTPSNLKGAKPGSIAFDRARSRAVLYGGLSGETWEHVNGDWTRRLAQGIPGSLGSSVVYDVSRGRTMAIGITGFIDTSLQWDWDGIAWRANSAANDATVDLRYEAAMTSAPGLSQVVLFGGGYADVLGDTWVWSDQTWTRPCKNEGDGCPPPRMLHCLVYDDTRNRVVLFAGVDVANAGYRTDSWAWDGSTWTQIGTTGPTGSGCSGAYDRVRDKIVAAVVGPDSMMWEYDPIKGWVDLGVPSAFGAALVYDPRLQLVLSYDNSDPAGETIDYWDGTSWSKLADFESSPPSARGRPAVSFDEGRGRMVFFGGFENSGLLDTWEQTVRGNACTQASDCHSGFCVDGVCCERSSCGTCERCDLDGAVGEHRRGLCTLVDAGDTDDTCAGARICSAVGHCGFPIGAQCSVADDCAEKRCEGGRCVGERPNGAVCSDDTRCRSLNCVDGVCCEDACDGTCRACDLPNPVTHQVDGVCRVAAGEDRDGECTGSGGCGGLCGELGMCVYPSSEQRCDVCAACDGSGRCNAAPASGRDTDCAEVDCAVKNTECRTYRAGAAHVCIGIRACALATDPGICESYDNVADGTPCDNGICERGECVPVKPKPGGCSFTLR